MRSIAATTFLLLLLSLSAAAADKPQAHYPDDYQPHPCAPAIVCKNIWDMGSMPSAASSMLGLSIDRQWLEAHREELLPLLHGVCPKLGSCYAEPGNTAMFCNDLVVPEMRAVCDRYKGTPTAAADFEQCRSLVEIVMLGIDAASIPSWKEAQACTKSRSLDAPSNVPPVVWHEPESLSPTYTGAITFYAIDAVTHRPLLADVKIEDQIVYTAANPVGIPQTVYPFKWPVKLKRVRRADGHEDAVPPPVTIQATGYPAVVMPMPYEPSSLVIEFTPALAKLKPGRNTVRFTATDSVTGKPVDTRLMFGDTVVGDSNLPKPITIEVPRGRKHADLWAWALNRNYSDVVLLPAVK